MQFINKIQSNLEEKISTVVMSDMIIQWMRFKKSTWAMWKKMLI